MNILHSLGLCTDNISGNYIRYSRLTACENPKMILREYDHLLIEKIKLHKDEDMDDYYWISEPYGGWTGRTQREWSGTNSRELIVKGLTKSMSTKSKKLKVRVHVRELQKKLERYDQAVQFNLNLEKEIDEIIRERDEFIDRYNPN